MRSNLYGALPTGVRPTCSGDLPASPAPEATIRVAGSRIFVDYDIPNYYCLPSGDWPPGYTCFNDVQSGYHASTLTLFRDDGTVMKTAWAYYENGSWDTGVNLTSCGNYRVAIVLTTTSGTVRTDLSPVYLAPTGVACATPDRGTCPAGGGGMSAGTGVAMPINVGSGDVSTTIPLFTLQQSPMPLVFNLAYHSSNLTYGTVAVPEPIGKGWTHPFNQVLKPIPSTNRLYHYTADGREFEYTQSGSVWNASRPAEARGTVTLNGTTHIYELTDLDGTKTQFYDSSGLAAGPAGGWVSTTDRWGNAITSLYSSGSLTRITDSVGRQLTLGYSAGVLQSISVPETPTPRVWSFTVTSGLLMAIRDPDPRHASINWRSLGYTGNRLAAITDDGPKTLEGHTYDAQGRGFESYSEGSTRNYVKVEYDQPLIGQRRVTTRIDASTNQVSIFTVEYQGGRWLPTSIVGPCSTCAGAGGDTQSFTYYADNHVDTVKDGRGNVTKFGYNANGNVTSMTEAQNDSTVARTTTWDYTYAAWPNFWTVMTQPSVASPGPTHFRTTGRSLTGAGEITLTVTESGYLTSSTSTQYITTYTFDTRHRLKKTEGPRSVADTTTYDYSADTPVSNGAGRLFTVTDAVGLITKSETYDVFGTARKITDPNLVVTELETDEKGRIKTSTSDLVSTDPNEPTNYVTSFFYDARDRLQKTTLPRQNGFTFGYEDGTNRLVDTTRFDSAGLQQERLHLTLNDYGGKTQEEAQKCTAPASTCLPGNWSQQRSEKFTYDTKNRLSQILHPVPVPADSTKVIYTYDANGMLQTVQDELHTSANTLYDYDALNRLSRVRQTLAGAVATPNPNCPVEAGKVATCYRYDAHDNLTRVIDPNGNETIYTFDDFRRMTSQSSPVSGTTSYTSYDEAGNLLTSTDANSATTTRTYDDANRPKTVSSARLGFTTENVTYTYDDPTAGRYGKGRLTRMVDPSGSVDFSYDRRGLLRAESRVINASPSYSQSYGYDANGNRTRVTYPSGRVVNYTFDFADRSYSATGPGVTYVTSTTYYPFGPENVLNLGNVTTRTAAFDLRYRPATLTLTGASSSVSYTYGLDAPGNITTVTDNVTSAYNRNFGYDDLNRLTSATTGGGLWNSPGTFTYDSLGNRKTMNLGARSVSYTYEAVSGHDTSRLWSVSEGSQAVRHDNAGNEYQFGAAVSTYSPRNYMASAETTAFQYDGRGLRVIEQSASGGSLFFPVTPCRVFDTRNANGPYGGPAMAAGETRPFTIWGQCGIPASGPRAIALNLTAVSPPGIGSLTLFPTGVALPAASAISVRTGITRANNGQIGLSAAGSISLNNSLAAAIHMVLDVNGYFADAPLSSRYFFYTPEMNLLAETGITPSGQNPAPLYEYIWFGGRPVAQETVGSSATRWTMTDHLGTPFLQMDSAKAVTWRAEYEPFGRVYAYTVGSIADPQPLRFPGQEARTTHAGRSYNVFRWYRGDVGQYTQADPVGLGSGAIAFFVTGLPPSGTSLWVDSIPVDPERMGIGDLNVIAYARGNPLRLLDATGEAPINFDGPDRPMRTKGVGRICQVRGDSFRLRLDFASPGTVNNQRLPPRLHINFEIPGKGINAHISIDPRTALEKCGPLCRGVMGTTIRRIPVVIAYPCLLNPALPGCQESPDL